MLSPSLPFGIQSVNGLFRVKTNDYLQVREAEKKPKPSLPSSRMYSFLMVIPRYAVILLKNTRNPKINTVCLGQLALLKRTCDRA